MVTVGRAELTIRTDGDVLRRERLTRSLYSELRTIDGIDVRFATEPPPREAGAKGAGALGDASLWVFLAAGTSGGARVLVAAIQAWVQRERHRVVRLTLGDRSIDIPWAMTQDQQRLIEAFLRSEEE
jgi:hypothetical protein